MTLKAETENAANKYLQCCVAVANATVEYVEAQSKLARADGLLNSAAAEMYNTLQFNKESIIHISVSGKVIEIPFGAPDKIKVLKVLS
jgi:hypothetical protein